ncbi:NERD domain-containing protein [Exiguobacterium sp. CinTr1]|uniref:NERD domain-containing protein n=1 Tax=Exiguobacterium sp. CinTr1 TaxID=2995315 RepID=UPI0022E51527|nr:NERD domain-containing protein [Exiguobacterium sp. CinTr1]
MLQVLTATEKQPVKQQTKKLFRVKEEVMKAPTCYTDRLVENIRQTCRFDWMMIEQVKLGDDLVHYVLVGPKGVFLIQLNRTPAPVHMTNRECRTETSMGWKQVYPHPVTELERMTKQVRSRLKKECNQAIPVYSFLIFPETVRLKLERIKANCGDSFALVDQVINKKNLETLTEPLVKQIAYYCSERQVHK